MSSADRRQGIALLHAVAAAFRALGNADRLGMTYELLEHDEGLCVGDLARLTGCLQSGASRHLQALERAGLVRSRRRGRRVIYRLRDGHLLWEMIGYARHHHRRNPPE